MRRESTGNAALLYLMRFLLPTPLGCDMLFVALQYMKKPAPGLPPDAGTKIGSFSVSDNFKNTSAQKIK